MFKHDQGRRTRRRSLRKVRIAIVAAAIAVSAACADSSGGGLPDPNGTPRQGGNITMLHPGDARGLSPYTGNITPQGDGSRMSAIYDVLVWADPATGTVRPQMAESLVPNGEATIWTLTLRDGIRFTDGAELNAEAVKRAWEKHLDPKLQSQQIGTVQPLTLTVVDKLRLSIKLPAPNANFDRTIAHSLNYVPSPRTLDSDEALAASRTAPVGAGPYKLREWVPGSHMVLERNPNYWQQGKPYLDTVTIRVSTNSETLAKDIDGGKADIGVTTDVLRMADAKDLGLATDQVRLNGGQQIVFNTRDKRPLANPDLRRAIALSLSTDDINKVLFESRGAPAKGIFEASSPLANIQLTLPQNNPEEAARLFAKATNNGRNPVTTKFVTVTSPKSVRMAQYFKERIEAVSKGMLTVEVVALEIPEYSQRMLKDLDYDMGTNILWAEDPEPALFQYLHSKSGRSNVTGYQNPAVDAALEAARVSTDRTVRTEAYTRVQVALIQDMPVFVYQEAPVGYIANTKLTGIQLFSDGHILWDRIGLRK
ncbi:ABC transporter substrate-binding protein [Yinghuangia sp. YIM S10712]|uniref:ABC transporter substrate-binding protein n=1 Tax=Yinghuangia sp. YIM S10712 TaxID=3436930 RepID=UPI003F5345DC